VSLKSWGSRLSASMTEANKAYTEVKRPSVAPLPHPTTAVLSSNTFLETATACIDNKLNVDTIYLNTSGQGFRQSPTQTFFFLLGLRLLFELTMLISLFYLHIIIFSMINISKTGYPSVFWLHVKNILVTVTITATVWYWNWNLVVLTVWFVTWSRLG